MPKALQRELEAKLAALNHPEWDSSDEDEGNNVEMKEKKKKKKKINLNKQTGDRFSKENQNEASDVIYVGHLPREFEERELKGFLGQFGRVLRLKLFRSRKTANSRCFAFVKFEDEEVASIVSETMSGYLMGEKRLVCHVIPKDKIHPDLFKESNRIFKKVNFRKIHRNKVNRPKSADRMQKITKTLLIRERKKRKKLKELGINYDFPGYETSNAKQKMDVDSKKSNDSTGRGQSIDVTEQKSPDGKPSKKQKLNKGVDDSEVALTKTPTGSASAKDMDASVEKVKSSKKKKKKKKVKA
mmetsp:Transcript_3903/g.6143  ORF Transcript_3903/g.6143 Transcript_3903/m.6143 type:complete len:299 (-) Transcript_3903:189-1085(-)